MNLGVDRSSVQTPVGISGKRTQSVEMLFRNAPIDTSHFPKRHDASDVQAEVLEVE